MDSRIFDIVSAKLATRKLQAEIDLEKIINDSSEGSSEEISTRIINSLDKMVGHTSAHQLWTNLLKQTQERPEEANNNKTK